MDTPVKQTDAEKESSDLGWIAIDPTPRGLGNISRYRVTGMSRQVNRVTLLAAQFFVKHMGKPVLRAELAAHLRKHGIGTGSIGTALGELRGALEEKYGAHKTNQIFDTSSSHGRTVITIAAPTATAEAAGLVVRSTEDVQKLAAQDGHRLAYAVSAGADAGIIQALKDKFPGIIAAGDQIFFRAYDPDFQFAPAPKPVMPVRAPAFTAAPSKPKPKPAKASTHDDEAEEEEEEDVPEDLEPLDKILGRARVTKTDPDEEGPRHSDDRTGPIDEDEDEDEEGDTSEKEREEDDEENAETAPEEPGENNADAHEADNEAARHAEERLAQERAAEAARIAQDRSGFVALGKRFETAKAANDARYAEEAAAQAAQQAREARNDRRRAAAERGMEKFLQQRADQRAARKASRVAQAAQDMAPSLSMEQIISGPLPAKVDMGHFSASFNAAAKVQPAVITSGKRSKSMGEKLFRQLLMLYSSEQGLKAEDMGALYSGKTPRSTAFRGIADLREAIRRIGLSGNSIITQDAQSRYHFMKKETGAKPGMK